jgi:glycosyltransferase involved in cell wall biosynthesis
VSQPRQDRPKWLVVVPQLPRSDQAAGDRRLCEILEFVSHHCDVSIVAAEPRVADSAVREERMMSMGVHVRGYGIWSILAALVRHPFDAIFIEFHNVAQPLLHFFRAVHPRAYLIIDSVDLHYLREAAREGVSANDAWRGENGQAELATYKAADATVVVTQEEKAELEQRGVRTVTIVPIIVPVRKRTQRAREDVVLFVGGFRHLPNVDAVLWFARQIWPSIVARVPAARFVVVGSETPEAIRALSGEPGIEVRGFVEDTAPLLDGAQVSVAPLTYGAGMKGKVSEALAAGIPVVTTSWGAQGLTEGAGNAYLLADDAGGFADAVVSLLNDESLRTRLSENGQELARGKCSIEAAEPALRVLIESSLVQQSRSGVVARAWRFCAHVGKRRVMKAVRVFRSGSARRSIP